MRNSICRSSSCGVSPSGFRENSPVQYPERLYREKGLMAFALLCVLVFVTLLFVDLPFMYAWFHVQPPEISPFWTF